VHKRNVKAPVNECMHVLITSWLKVGLNIHYKLIFWSEYQIKGQLSMTYTVP